MKADGSVKMYFERPIDGGFQHATYYLPSYRWEEIKGFTDQEVQKLERLLQNFDVEIDDILIQSEREIVW